MAGSVVFVLRILVGRILTNLVVAIFGRKRSIIVIVVKTQVLPKGQRTYLFSVSACTDASPLPASLQYPILNKKSENGSSSSKKVQK